jgi:hypothetical protein
MILVTSNLNLFYIKIIIINIYGDNREWFK